MVGREFGAAAEGNDTNHGSKDEFHTGDFTGN
jgi:hypothetical protein